MKYSVDAYTKTKLFYKNRKEWQYSFREKIGPKTMKIGRNSLCPCGSSKKYKHCCLNSATAMEQLEIDEISAQKKPYASQEEFSHEPKGKETGALTFKSLSKMTPNEFRARFCKNNHKNYEECQYWFRKLDKNIEISLIKVEDNYALATGKLNSYYYAHSSPYELLSGINKNAEIVVYDNDDKDKVQFSLYLLFQMSKETPEVSLPFNLTKASKFLRDRYLSKKREIKLSKLILKIKNNHALMTSKDVGATSEIDKTIKLTQKLGRHSEIPILRIEAAKDFSYTMNSFRNAYGSMDDFFDSLFFSFNDGVTIRLSDLFFHPYIFFIEEFFKDWKKSSSLFDDYGYNYSYGQIEDDELIDFSNLIEDRPHYTQINFFNKLIPDFIKKIDFYFHIESKDKTAAFLIKKVVKNLSSYTWRIEEKNGCLSSFATQSSHDIQHLAGNYFYDFETCILGKNKDLQIKNILKGIFSENTDNHYSKLQKIEGNYLQSHIETLRNEYSVVVNFEPKEICKLKLYLDLSIDKSNKQHSFIIKPLAKIKEEEASFSLAQDQYVLSFIYFLENGIKGYFTEEGAKSLISRRRDEKRQNGLKLIRHKGLILPLLKVFLELAKGNIDEKSFKNDVKHLILKIVLKMDDLEEKLINKTFKKFFGDKIFRFIEIMKNDFFQPEKIFINHGETIYYVKRNDLLLKLLSPIVNTFIEILDKKSFLKVNSQIFEIIFKEDTTGLIEDIIQFKTSFALENFLSQDDEDLNITINGKELQTLDPRDLISKFEIKADQEIGQDKKIDWFELHPRVFLKGKRVETYEELDLLNGGIINFKGSYYKLTKKSLPKIKWLNYFWEKIKTKSSRKINSIEATIEQIPANIVLEFLAMEKQGIVISGNQEWENIRKEFARIESNQEKDLDISFEHIKLKPFQKSGVRWLIDLYSLKLGAILADDMGLGKTVQTIAFFSYLLQKKKLKHALVIVPTSLTYNWISEFQKFAPNIAVFNFSSDRVSEHKKFITSNQHSVTLITYGLFVRNFDSLSSDSDNQSNKPSWNIAVFDEGQNLKNIAATRTSKARALKANFKLVLSGTPMENHYGEFYSLVDLVLPSALGNYTDFMKKFNFKASSNDVKKLSKEIEFLKMKTAPVVLRRTKSNVLSELPEKSEEVIRLDFEDKQKKIYRDLAVSWNSKIQDIIEEKGEAKSKLEVLTAILRLRQACSHPGSLPNIKYNDRPPKLKRLISHLEVVKSSGNKALIFTNFRSTIELLEKHLKDTGFNVLIIHGGTTKGQREKRLEEFNKYDGPIFLIMTLKTGGVGLNLTSANYVFHLEPWWNPASEEQATDRVYRIGQKQRVNIYRYIMKDSIEEKIMDLKHRKSLAIKELFEENPRDLNGLNFKSSTLTFDEFKNLSSIDKF